MQDKNNKETLCEISADKNNRDTLWNILVQDKNNKETLCDLFKCWTRVTKRHFVIYFSAGQE